MKKSEFANLITPLYITFNCEVNKERTDIYYEFLGDYKYELLKKVFKELIETEKYFPAIATIKRLIVDETFDIPTEADVINDLFGAIDGYGIYSNPKFIYPITNALVEELGWQTINNMTPENVNKAIHFRYEKVAKQYERCLLRSEPFPINKIKGIFALQEGRKTIVQKGSVSLNELLMEVKNNMPDKIRLLNRGKNEK